MVLETFTFEVDVAQWIIFPAQKAIFPWSGTIPDGWNHKPMPNPGGLKYVHVTGILAGTKGTGTSKRFHTDITSITFLGSAPPGQVAQGECFDFSSY